MSYPERKIVVYLMSSLLIFGLYGFYVWQIHQDGNLETTNWGTTILLLIPVHIAINVIMEVLFVIFNTIITQEGEPSIVDELDKSIELRAPHNTFIVFMLGFLIALGTVALDMPLYVMFNLFVLAFFAGSIVWSSSHLYFYRRGF